MIDSIHGPPRHTFSSAVERVNVTQKGHGGHVSPGRLEIQLYGQRVLLDVLDRHLVSSADSWQ